MSEYALERARAKVRRRRKKPHGPRPVGPWWTDAVWTVALLGSYVRYGIKHEPLWAALAGLGVLLNGGGLWWSLTWWRWERQEGTPHVLATWWDRLWTVVGVVILLSNLLWLGGVR